MLVPLYHYGIFRRKCIYCGEKTRERIFHEVNFSEGFSKFVYYKLYSQAQHHQCHDAKCQNEDCQKCREAAGKALVYSIFDNY